MNLNIKVKSGVPNSNKGHGMKVSGEAHLIKVYEHIQIRRFVCVSFVLHKTEFIRFRVIFEFSRCKIMTPCWNLNDESEKKLYKNKNNKISKVYS